MDAELLLKERHILAGDTFVELVVRLVPAPRGSKTHSYKYRLALVVDGVCVLRYDNESGKGDHKHMGTKEIPYDFTTPQTLLADLWNDVDRWRA